MIVIYPHFFCMIRFEIAIASAISDAIAGDGRPQGEFSGDKDAFCDQEYPVPPPLSIGRHIKKRFSSSV